MRLLGVAIVFCLAALPAIGLDQPITFQPVSDQPYWQTPELVIDSADYDTLILKIESKQNGTAKLFWMNHYDMQFNQPKSTWFSVKAGTHDYYLNIASQNQYWMGWIKGLLLYPEFDSKSITINEANIIKGNIFTNIMSGWQEFWGPKGRLIIGSTINTMQSSYLFGRSIFVYIYWMIGIFSVFFLLKKIKKLLLQKQKLSFELLFNRAGKVVVGTIIFFWCLLELNTMYNNWQMARMDFPLIGKTIDEQRTLVNTGDFYQFMLFCEKYISPEADFDYSIPPVYNDIKARFYLYPRKITKEADFLVVYDKDPEKEQVNRYKPWKTFRQGAYIAKKR